MIICVSSIFISKTNFCDQSDAECSKLLTITNGSFNGVPGFTWDADVNSRFSNNGYSDRSFSVINQEFVFIKERMRDVFEALAVFLRRKKEENFKILAVLIGPKVTIGFTIRYYNNSERHLITSSTMLENKISNIERYHNLTLETWRHKFFYWKEGTRVPNFYQKNTFEAYMNYPHTNSVFRASNEFLVKTEHTDFINNTVISNHRIVLGITEKSVSIETLFYQPNLDECCSYNGASNTMEGSYKEQELKCYYAESDNVIQPKSMQDKKIKEELSEANQSTNIIEDLVDSKGLSYDDINAQILILGQLQGNEEIQFLTDSEVEAFFNQIENVKTGVDLQNE